jgi:Predicted transcriptional regulators
MDGLSIEALQQVAAYFQVLSEPTRLQILDLLRDGERNVGELAGLCGCTSANISRHLAQLAHQGLIARESRGTSVYCRIADESGTRFATSSAPRSPGSTSLQRWIAGPSAVPGQRWRRGGAAQAAADHAELRCTTSSHCSSTTAP